MDWFYPTITAKAYVYQLIVTYQRQDYKTRRCEERTTLCLSILSMDDVHSKSNIVLNYSIMCIVSQRPYAYVIYWDSKINYTIYTIYKSHRWSVRLELTIGYENVSLVVSVRSSQSQIWICHHDKSYLQNELHTSCLVFFLLNCYIYTAYCRHIRNL